jgi:hypothetical protein
MSRARARGKLNGKLLWSENNPSEQTALQMAIMALVAKLHQVADGSIWKKCTVHLCTVRDGMGKRVNNL